LKIIRKYYFLDFVEVEGGVLDAADVFTGGVGLDEFVLLRTLLVELGDDALLLLFVVEDDAAVLTACDSVFDLILEKMLWLLTFAFVFEFTFGTVFVDVDTWLEEVLEVVEGVVAVLLLLLLLLLLEDEEVGGDEEVAPVVVIVGNAPVFDIFVFEFELLIIAMPLLAFEIEDVVDVVE
jgi:hypothetical protein